jgi:hypothetical protein
VRLQLQRMALPDGTKPPGLVSAPARLLSSHLLPPQRPAGADAARRLRLPPAA